MNTKQNGTALINDQSHDAEPAIEALFQEPEHETLHHELHQEILEIWHDAKRVQSKKPDVNTTVVVYWLQLAEQAMEKEPADIPVAMRSVVKARYWLHKVEACAGWHNWGLGVLWLELVYLISVPVTIFFYINTKNIVLKEVMVTGFQIAPLYVFVWGFLGGVAWCMYSAAYWTTRRLFDRYYLTWYIAHPWISAVVAGAVSLVFYAGLVAIAPSDTDPGIAFAATISVVSFVTGFSTKYIWGVLDRNVKKLLGDTGGERSEIEDISVDLPGHVSV